MEDRSQFSSKLLFLSLCSLPSSNSQLLPSLFRHLVHAPPLLFRLPCLPLQIHCLSFSAPFCALSWSPQTLSSGRGRQWEAPVRDQRVKGERRSLLVRLCNTGLLTPLLQTPPPHFCCHLQTHPPKPTTKVLSLQSILGNHLVEFASAHTSSQRMNYTFKCLRSPQTDRLQSLHPVSLCAQHLARRLARTDY